jgi:hypothetical protein
MGKIHWLLYETLPDPSPAFVFSSPTQRLVQTLLMVWLEIRGSEEPEKPLCRRDGQ